MRIVALLTIFLFVSLSHTAGLYPDNSNIIQLNKNTFHQVFDTPHTWMVEFYAPWCGHCKNLAPAWEAAATNLKGVVRVAAVNCDEDRELAQMFEIKGFPTILYFGSETSQNPYQRGLPWKTPEPYQGPRTAVAIANFATSKLPDFVQSTGLQKFFGSDYSLPKVVLFSDKPKPSNIYKGLAIDFKDRLSLAYVQSSDKALADRYGITTFPSLIVDQGNDQVTFFDQKFSYENLHKFLSQFAKPVSSSQRGKTNKEPEPEPDRPAEVIFVSTAEEFEENCLSKNGPTAIAFFDKSDQEELDKFLATSLEVAEKYKKQFRFLWVNGPDHIQFIENLHINSGFPQLVVLNPKKKAFAAMVGAYEVSSISSFLDRVLMGSKRLVRQLDEIPAFP